MSRYRRSCQGPSHLILLLFLLQLADPSFTVPTSGKEQVYYNKYTASQAGTTRIETPSDLGRVLDVSAVGCEELLNTDVGSRSNRLGFRMCSCGQVDQYTCLLL
ncbi:hypothetical protein BT96DRAFT_701183 [Gymnopus androsaceus JB14]|uniref:Uncharacterized protein n=1 Tax=Gymnopus androsaceus JB14 TaxID=1447944 RepID=A0A6A4IET5_9AGAR|nr:hypothetical protein BT96DRAFT_701183 [Gymnopus androsaceus JB14]